MALEPITRQEKIIAGQDLTPITRMEMFLKNFGGGGGGGGGVLIVNITNGPENGLLVADKTVAEIIAAAHTQLVFAQYSVDDTSGNGTTHVIAGPLARIETLRSDGVERAAVFFAGYWYAGKDGGYTGGITGMSANGVDQWIYYA